MNRLVTILERGASGIGAAVSIAEVQAQNLIYRSGLFSNMESGQSLIQVIIVAGILGIIMTSMVGITSIGVRQQKQSNLSFQASSISRNLLSVLNNGQSWMNTYQNPANNQASGALLDCLMNSKPCTADESTDLPTGTPISGNLINKVFDAAGGVALDSSAAQNGFTSTGATCTTFNPAPGAGTDACPLRFEAHWTAICSAATNSCVNPQVQLQIKAFYNPSPGSQLAFNPANYGTQLFYQGQVPGGCWLQGGTSLWETCATTIGIGTTVPETAIDLQATNQSPVVRIENSDSSAPQWPIMRIQNYMGAVGLGYPTIQLSNNRGNDASYVADQAGDWMGSIEFYANDGNEDISSAPGQSSMGARIEAVAAQNFTPAGHGGSLLFATTPNNSINYPTDRMIIDQNGQVGIGVFPPNYALDVLGDVNSSTALWVQGIRVCTSGGCTAASDQRLKKNIKPLPDSLTSLLKLQAVSYDWIDPEKFGKGPQVGLIAQEVEKVYPQVVVTEPKTGMKGIAYDHLVAPVIEAIRAVVAKISALENHIADLLKASEEHSRDIALLKSRLEKAERENAAQRIYFCSKDPSAPFCH